VAAPPFREILKDSLRYLEVPAHELKDQTKDSIEQVLVPDVVNLPLAEAISTINNRGLNVKVSGTGNIVWQQTPKPQTKINRGSQVIISLSPFAAGEQNSEVTVPDLQGKSMKEVAKILSDLGLHLLPEGYGLAYEQTPEAGKVITSGSSIKVKFQPVGE
jgi:stage V sporulation protein D (sporulation-specific penicillin-binding protein)